MKSKEDTSTPDSANISDMQTNEEDDERSESRERSRGKRRTAREIASMFEQLKQRHIARKKEWQEEKEELLKRAQTADESKRVLTELKSILEQLREELRLEEKRRIEMEAEHLDERQRWNVERNELLKRLEENAQESDKGGKDMKRMTEKLSEQSRQLSDSQSIVLELKKQLLEKENKYLRDKRELKFEFEKDRSAWKRKEKELNDKIKQLDNKSSTPSTSPVRYDIEIGRDIANFDELVSKRKTSAASPTALDNSNYSIFQRTVDDALKQIEKISNDLGDMDSSSPQRLSDYTSATPSPRPPGATSYHLRADQESSPSPNAPWRTKRKTSPANQTQSPDNKKSSLNVVNTPTDASISLPSITSAKVQMKLSPNPERKVHKISRQGSKVDIIVSSPDAPKEADSNEDTCFPFGKSGVSERKSEIVLGAPQYDRESAKTGYGRARVPSMEKSPVLSRQRKFDHGDDVPDSNAKYDGIGKSDRKDSPSKNGVGSEKLPKLHQQLLFKREPSLPLDKNLRRSFESDTLTPTGKVKLGADEDMPGRHRVSDSSSVKTHTPYFDPEVGYRTGSKSPNKWTSAQTPDLKTPSFLHRPKPEPSVTVTAPNVETKKGSSPQPPSVQPKPRVSILKDDEGNIVRVSPAPDRKSISPESNQSEKQNSIGRMGKAGRDWIRKKLSFRDRKLEEQDIDKTRHISEESPKKKTKTKTRQRASSLLRNSRVSLKSVSSTEESDDGEGRRRESFLRRSRKKGKSPGQSKNSSPSKSKPKKYTRSKTEASPKDMKNFLNKFKASQNNPSKPSVLKQFEMKLLENEVKTLNEEKPDNSKRRKQPTPKSQLKINMPPKPSQEEDGYLSEEEGDEEVDPFSPAVEIPDPMLSITQKPTPQHPVTVRTKSPPSSTDGKKTYFRKSMTDFKPSGDDNWLAEIQGDSPSGNRSMAADEAEVLCEKKAVSKLVNRFSASIDEGLLGVKKPLQQRPTRRSSLKVTNLELNPPEDHNTIPRSYSLTSQQGTTFPRRTRFSSSMRTSTEALDQIPEKGVNKKDTRAVSWRDRVIAKPDSDASESSSVVSSAATLRDRKSGAGRQTASVGKFDSLSSFWESERPPIEEEELKPGRMKMMSEEMKRKTTILENALSKGPRKPRRYRRAETQPVHSNLDSSEEETASESPPSKYSNHSKPVDLNLEDSTQMHTIIPPVTGKFNKPAKPGRVPSRWAR